MAEASEHSPIFGLHNPNTSTEPAPEPVVQSVAKPRNSWDINTPIDRRSICVEDAIRHYNDTHEDDMVFLKDNKPVQIDVDENGSATIARLDYQQVRTVLGKGAVWYKAGKEEEVEVNPTRDLAEWTISAGCRELPNVPVLEDVTSGILLDRDWRVIHTRGYDKKTRYYLTNDYPMDKVPDIPTENDVNVAKNCIWEVFQDFLYKDKDLGQNSVNFQNTVFGMVITAIRPTWKGALPLIVIKKSSPRIGGSLLAETIWIGATGEKDITKTIYPDTAAEYAKIIRTVISEGRRVCSIDNVVDKYNWVTPMILSQTTGNGGVCSRDFGQNTNMTSHPPKTVFLYNGINMDIVSDVCGRVVPIYLEGEKMWQNTNFAMGEEDLRQKTYTLFPKIIWSIATIHQNWVAHGRPAPKECNGNFSAYQNLWYEVGGMMQCAGYTKVLDNLKEAQMDYNDADNKTADLLNALGRTFTKRFTTTELEDEITYQCHDKRNNRNRDADALINNIPDEWFELAAVHRLNPNKMGDLLRPYVDQVVNGSAYILRKKKSDGRMKYWLADRFPKD